MSNEHILCRLYLTACRLQPNQIHTSSAESWHPTFSRSLFTSTDSYHSTLSVSAAMSTLADDLLKDFEDSGSENEDQQENEDGVFPTPPTTNGASPDGMILDGDEEADDEDVSMNGDLKDAEDEDEAKAKVEKMELGRVSDVRSVAGLMKTLEPVLEVSISCSQLFHFHLIIVYISCEYSPDSMSLPSENCPLSDTACRKWLCWKHRRQPGIPSPHAGEYSIYFH